MSIASTSIRVRLYASILRYVRRPTCTTPPFHNRYRRSNLAIGCALLALARSRAIPLTLAPEGCLPSKSPSPSPLRSCARRSSSSIRHIPWMKPSRSSPPVPVGSHSALHSRVSPRTIDTLQRTHTRSPLTSSARASSVPISGALSRPRGAPLRPSPRHPLVPSHCPSLAALGS